MIEITVFDLATGKPLNVSLVSRVGKVASKGCVVRGDWSGHWFDFAAGQIKPQTPMPDLPAEAFVGEIWDIAGVPAGSQVLLVLKASDGTDMQGTVSDDGVLQVEWQEAGTWRVEIISADPSIKDGTFEVVVS